MTMTNNASRQPLTKKVYKEQFPSRKGWDDKTPEEQNEAYCTNPYFENWMLMPFYVYKLFDMISFDITMDGCCDLAGSNKYADKWCSAEESCLDANLDEEHVYANTPFRISDQFVEHFEATKRRSRKFKALIIVPDRHSNDWHRNMVARNNWRLLFYYPVGTKLFTEPGADVYDREKRCKEIPSREVILALVLNDELD